MQRPWRSAAYWPTQPVFLENRGLTAYNRKDPPTLNISQEYAQSLPTEQSGRDIFSMDVPSSKIASLC